ncbi:MAG: response regulator transcription factor [Bacteroidales bacterium]|nr:response regulator transcription factor [Bacteroidales bacterium]
MGKIIKILLVEDEQMLAEILSDTLKERDFEVTLAFDGVQGLEKIGQMHASGERFDVIVTDVMMPNMDGFTMVKKLKETGNNTPVLFLTARSATADVVKGFEIGGNDYLKKPFAIDELIVRVKALAGRAVPVTETVYTIGKFTFNSKSCTLSTGEKSTKLSAREAAVLQHLCMNMEKVTHSSVLLKELWGDDNFFNLRSLNVHITHLRNYLKDDPCVKITSIRNTGYRLETDNQY